MAKNLSIVAQGISGDEGHLLGYNISDNGVYTPAIGDVVRGTTATYVAQDGLIKTAPPNVARVDYTNGVAELLLEPTRTNFMQQSINIPSLLTSFNGGVYTSGGIKSPDGSNNAWQIMSPNGSGGIQRFRGLSATKTFSVFIKGTEQGQTIRMEDVNGTFSELKTLSTKWERYSITFTSSVSGYRITEVPQNSVYIYGIQVEDGDTTTSLIITGGSSVTRSADRLYNFGSSEIIDSTSGTLFLEGSAVDTNASYSISLISSDTTSRLNFYLNGDSMFVDFYYNNTQISTTQAFVGDVNINRKYAVKYNNSSLTFYSQGQQIKQVFGTFNSSYDNISLEYTPNLFNFYGRVQQVKHLPYNTDISKL